MGCGSSKSVDQVETPASPPISTPPPETPPADAPSTEERATLADTVVDADSLYVAMEKYIMVPQTNFDEAAGLAPHVYEAMDPVFRPSNHYGGFEGIEQRTHDAYARGLSTSYYAYYFLLQVQNGNVAQFAFNSEMHESVVPYVMEGLKQCGAVDLVALLDTLSTRWKKLSDDERSEFLMSELFGENNTRDVLNEGVDVSGLESNLPLMEAWLRPRVVPFSESIFN